MVAPLLRARALLQRTFGHPDFRPLQSRVVSEVLAGRDVLAVLPTGGGKSLCFQIPALLDRGLTLVVSPLIALMQDQVAALRRRGIPSGALNSTLDPAERMQLLADAAADGLRLLYVSPERLPRAVDELRSLGGEVARLAIDEAHCIVEWGHDFRPAYRQIHQARSALGMPPVVALTGSATPTVRREITTALGFRSDHAEVIGSFDRRNLRFEVVGVQSTQDRTRHLLRLLRTTSEAAIVYAPTRGLVEGLTRLLRDQGIAAAPYHAGLEHATRSDVLTGFLGDRYRVVVATCAFGMGIDKPTVRLVVHWTLPGTPESYYQEAGRAGRDGQPGRCVLLHHPADVAHPSRQLDVTFPREQVLKRLWEYPEERRRHPASVVAAADRLAAELHPERGPVHWGNVRRRRREAERRLAAMVRYAQSRSCRRALLLDWFGEAVRQCSGCDRCTPLRSG